MPAIEWTLPAASCPAVQYPGDLILPLTQSPTLLPEWETGGAGQSIANFRQLARHAEAIGRWAGARAVVYGLDLVVVSGLSIKATAGAAMFDALVTLPADSAFPTALADASVNYCWYSSAVGLKSVAGNTTAPSPGKWTYLGAVTTAGGVVTHIDYAGRMFRLEGGMLQRRTGDAGAPADAPPSAVAFLAQTNGGMFLWDGGAYRKFVNPGGVLDSDLATPYTLALIG